MLRSRHRPSHLPRALAAAVVLLALAPRPGVTAPAPHVELEARMAGEGGTVTERVVAPGATLRSGDEVRLRITPSADGYLYVIALGSSGSAVLVHPFGGAPPTPVRAGEVQAVPPDGGYLPLDARTGRETLMAFVAEAPQEGLAGLLVRLESAAAGGGTPQQVLQAAGLEPATLSFAHVPPGAATVAGEGSSAPGATAAPAASAPAAPAGDDGGVLSGLGSRIADFTGKAPVEGSGAVAPGAPPAGAPPQPVGRPLEERAPVPEREPKQSGSPQSSRSSGGFFSAVAGLLGFGASRDAGSEAVAAPAAEPPPPAATFPLPENSGDASREGPSPRADQNSGQRY